MTDRTFFIPVVVSVMLRYRELLLTFAFCLYSTSPALECFSGSLPDVFDCQTLINAIIHWALMPGQNVPKEYGRTLDSDLYSENIPKIYHLHGPENYNCAILVDVKDTDYDAVDTFTIRDLSVAAHMVYSICLVGQMKIGLYVYT